MIEFPITILKDGQQIKEQHSMCSQWDDLTVKQFFQLKTWDGKDTIRLLSILTTIPYELLLTSPDYSIDDTLWPHTKFLDTPIDVKNFKTKTIKIQGKPYFVPTELNNPKNRQKFVLAQKDKMQKKFVETINETGDAINCLPFVLACYYYPIVKGIEFDSTESGPKFKTEDAQDFIPIIEQCNIMEAYSVFSFFLQKLTASQVARQPNLALNQIKNKKLQELVSSMFSKKLTPSTLSPEVMR